MVKFVLGLIFFICFLFSCVEGEDYDIPNFKCPETDIRANKSPIQIYNQSKSFASLYKDDDIIECYVISSDREGNFLKRLYMQALDRSIGLIVLTDYSKLAMHYPPGSKVFIRMRGLYTQIKDKSLLIGDFKKSKIVPISRFKTSKVLLRDCSPILLEKELEQEISVKEALYCCAYINKLVVLKRVQFIENIIGKNYFIKNKKLNIKLVDTMGNEIQLMGSFFSQFESCNIPKESGKVKGVLTKLGDSIGIVPRFRSDILLREKRF